MDILRKSDSGHSHRLLTDIVKLWNMIHLGKIEAFTPFQHLATTHFKPLLKLTIQILIHPPPSCFLKTFLKPHS